jgi:ribosomal protein S18 acetylase RimI-like enzyme
MRAVRQTRISMMFTELAPSCFDASWRGMNSTKADAQVSVVVRRMGSGELGEVIDTWYRSLIGSLAFLRPDQLRSEVDYKRFFREVVVTSRDLWVAELEGRVAGVLALEDVEIDRLYVAPEAQRRLVGAALLDHAKALHPNGLTLVTHQRNTGACRFYERHGFEVRKFGVSPPPESEPDVTYAWSPSSR